MTCSIPSCGKPVEARGWCSPHYHRWVRRGDPLAPPLKPWGKTEKANPVDLFWAKVRTGRGCWEWTAYVHHTGYGYFQYNGVVQGAHRVSWQIHHGPIPEGMRVCHHCDNPLCVRPDHLFLGTDADNAHDRDRKGRNINKRGPAHPLAKLTAADGAAIRAASAAGESRNSIARRLGWSRTTVSAVLQGRRWV